MNELTEEKGKRFSLVYLERGVPARDRQRFRNRLAAYYWEYLHKGFKDEIVKAMKREAGIEVPYYGNSGYSPSEVFKNGELRDVLDSITLVYQVLLPDPRFPDSYKSPAQNWHSFVSRVLHEENVGYVLDESCGVHYLVDQEFERNRASTLATLDNPRYGGVRAAFEDAFRHLDSDPKDTKAAVRSIFESLEILTKIMVKSQNLSRKVVESTLKVKCLSTINGDSVMKTVIEGLINSLANWVDALQYYRHGQESDEPIGPSEELTIHIISTGSSYIRWLSQFDQKAMER
ncbi:hypothetical protein MGMO_122c00010 [Methyloglobulus morosus KoM1]|uniref:Abortive infection protein-like C-terminal domain-containing protein n=1 Tax=Methyloglobulus morosus KoM1 TaxID=1116472 RepID=V5DSS4_9GAMM|nr:hypothetical protein [Methyloglobulus morosus]ESS70441.1 hypothetical protein MGMO_122c00010 [Methyloglobulus morosus KoM1]